MTRWESGPKQEKTTVAQQSKKKTKTEMNPANKSLYTPATMLL